MSYAYWPAIQAQCPVCGGSGCAVYRGYYTRFLFCAELEFIGRVAVRTGFCRRRRYRFTVLPDFMIHRRRLSRFSQCELSESFRRQGRLQVAIDDLVAGLGEEFYLPLSTAYHYLQLKNAVPP